MITDTSEPKDCFQPMPASIPPIRAVLHDHVYGKACVDMAEQAVNERPKRKSESWDEGTSNKVAKPTHPTSSKKSGQDDQTSRPREHLVNGNLQGLVAVHNYGIRIRVNNTCGFDALTEIVVNAYIEAVGFRRVVDSEKRGNKFLSFVATYANSGPTNSVYSLRAELLFEIYQHAYVRPTKHRPGRINCWSSIYRQFASLFSTNLSPTIERRSCHAGESCQESSKILYKISPQIPNIQELRFANLEGEVNKFLERNFEECGQCNFRKSATVLVSPSPIFLCIDVEDFFISPRQRQNNACSLQEIPITIRLKNINYTLVGAAEHQIGHYIAYCRSLHTNSWVRKDDMKNQTTQQRHSYAFFFYVRD